MKRGTFLWIAACFCTIVAVSCTFDWIKPSYWLSHSRADHFREKSRNDAWPSVDVEEAAFQRNIENWLQRTGSSSVDPLHKMLLRLLNDGLTRSSSKQKVFDDDAAAEYEDRSAFSKATRDSLKRLEKWLRHDVLQSPSPDETAAAPLSFSRSQTWGHLGVRKLPTHYVVVVEIPGIPANKIHVTVAKDTVSIKGTHDICLKKPAEVAAAGKAAPDAAFVLIDDKNAFNGGGGGGGGDHENPKKKQPESAETDKETRKDTFNATECAEADSICMERHVDRTFKIPPDVNHERVSAKLQDGILLLIMERTEGFEKEVPVVEQRTSFVDKLKETAESIKEKIHPDL